MKTPSPETSTPQPAATSCKTTPTENHDSTATSYDDTTIIPARTAAAEAAATVESESESIARYRRADQWCRHHIQANSDFLHCNDKFQVTMKQASQDMQFPILSLQSLFRNRFVQHLKQQQGGGHFKNKTFLYHQRDELLQHYHASANSSGDVGTSIVQLARHHKVSPFTMAKFLVEQMAVLPEEGGGEKRKKYLNAALRQPHVYLSSMDAIQEKFRATEEEWQQQQQHNPSTASNNSSEITTTTITTRLATQVAEAVAVDPLLGPRSDRMRHFVGIEYEVALEHMLSARNIPYTSELQLRQQGTSKTPDVVLKCPIAVQVGGSQQEWRMVTWIDSKALYGDVQTHQQSVLPQCQSYIHRFGPGMVLYFFGHAPLSLLRDGNGTENDDLVIVGWELPKSFLWPTGQMSDDIDEKSIRT